MAVQLKTSLNPSRALRLILIQQAIAQVLTPLWDGEFSENSFGFREGRNAHQAVRVVEEAWKLKRRHAVDCDLKAFFDTVKHDPLLARLSEKIGGGKLLRLIGRYPPQPWRECATSHRRTAQIRHRVDELLRDQPHLPRSAGGGGVRKEMD